MIHPHTELRFINDEVGYGVVATRFIPKGTITWAFDRFDREFTPTEVAGLEETYKQIIDKYCFRDSTGNYVLCWDHARYVNHSFNSNCLATAYNTELAIRDIQPGEELTDDYGYLNITEPFRANDEGRRRKTVYPDDLSKYWRIWDRKLLAAFKRFPHVDQPLRPLIGPVTWDTFQRIATGQQEMTSILACLYNRDNGNNGNNGDTPNIPQNYRRAS